MPKRICRAWGVKDNAAEEMEAGPADQIIKTGT
jgi:hypothetical protein